MKKRFLFILFLITFFCFPLMVTYAEAQNGWAKEDGKTYYYEEGVNAKGFKIIDEDLYFFSNIDGALTTGWKQAYSQIWYQDEEGKVLKGLQEIEGKKYYFNEETGYRESGFKEIDGNLYFFSGIDGALTTGWKQAYSQIWYQDEEGKVLKGLQEIEGKKYYFNEETGYRESGFKEIDGNLYFFSGIDGALTTGWKQAYSQIWYQDEEGKVLKGLQEIEGKKYYFNEETGYRESGFKEIDGNLYFFSGIDGALTTGWKQAYSQIWYQDEEGKVLKGLQEIEGKKYYFNEETGCRESGFKKIDGNLYFFSSVDGYVSSGWKYAYSQIWYQDETGIVVCGNQTIEGRDYNFGDDGFLDGFKNIGNTFVYYNPDGTMAKGIQRMAGKYYQFNEYTGAFEKYVNQRIVIDVSSHQGMIDWETVKNSGMVDAVILRAGYGVSWTDAYFQRNVQELNRLGIPYSVYLFSYAENGNEASMEADNLINIIKNNGANIASNIFSIYYDLEDWYISSTGENSNGISQDTYQEMFNSFSSKVEESLGIDVKIYASKNFIETRFPTSLRPEVGWVAQWGPELTYDGTYEGWQYTSDGSVPGINGRVDMNIFYY